MPEAGAVSGYISVPKSGGGENNGSGSNSGQNSPSLQLRTEGQPCPTVLAAGRDWLGCGAGWEWLGQGWG